MVPVWPCKPGGLLDGSGAVVHDGRLETGAVSEGGIIIIITNSSSINGANKSTPGKRQGREAKDDLPSAPLFSSGLLPGATAYRWNGSSCICQGGGDSSSGEAS